MGARTKARKRAVDVLFEADQRRLPLSEVLALRKIESGTQTPLPEYTVEVVQTVIDHADEVDEMIATYAIDWPLDRMPAVDRALARVATAEILYGLVPVAVAVDEAIELAKQLSTDDSADFLNGVLGQISRTVPLR